MSTDAPPRDPARRSLQLPPHPALVDDELRDKAKRIRLLAFDVDGVCTDGKLYYGADGEALHAFFARDGLGLVSARLAGLTLAAVSGRRSANVAARLTELKVPHLHLGILDKGGCFERLLDELELDWDDAAYIGDDINDLPVLDRVGLSAAVPDAARGVAERVDYVTEASGGRGALREFIEIVLDAQGRWPPF